MAGNVAKELEIDSGVVVDKGVNGLPRESI